MGVAVEKTRPLALRRKIGDGEACTYTCTYVARVFSMEEFHPKKKTGEENDEIINSHPAKAAKARKTTIRFTSTP